MNNVKLALLGLAFFLSLPGIAAAELGMNYYHETMMGTWGGQYIPRTDAEINSDLDDIKSVSNHIKLYANPLVDGNVDHTLRIARMANDKGFHVVVAMNTEDRELNDGNWGEYRNKVKDACPRFNGVADEFIVGNEIGLHSPWDSQGIRDRVEPLINECGFNGPKSYEAFWWDRDAWKSYDGRIYANMYEHYPLFAQNVDELKEWKHTPIIGEWGDNFGSEENQAEEIRKRWDKIQQSPTPVAYVFTYKEPSPSGTFGVLRNDGSRKPAWYALPSSGQQSAPAQQPEQSWTAPAQQATSQGGSIGDLPVGFTGSGGHKKQDVTMGDCRMIEYGSSGGDVKTLACRKGGDVEMYVQQSAQGTWRLSLGGGSVSDVSGFARFAMDAPAQTHAQEQPAPQSNGGIGSLSASFSGGSKLSDETSGTCRTLRYSTIAGEAKVLACEKGSDVEMYTQASPQTTWKLTLGSGSVSDMNGFARFALTPSTGGGSDAQSTHSNAATTPAPASTGWTSVPPGTLVKSEDMGSCKRAAFETSAGYIEALTCDKGGHSEMYLQSPANGAQISFGGLTVGTHAGFARG